MKAKIRVKATGEIIEVKLVNVGGRTVPVEECGDYCKAWHPDAVEILTGNKNINYEKDLRGM